MTTIEQAFANTVQTVQNKLSAFWNHREVVQIRSGFLYKTARSFLMLAQFSTIVSIAALAVLIISQAAPTIITASLQSAKWCLIFSVIGASMAIIWAGARKLNDLVMNRIHKIYASKA